MSRSDQPRDQVNPKMGDTAVVGVLDLGDIFKRILDRFNQRPLA